MTQTNDLATQLAAARRQAAEFVEEWRQDCRETVHRVTTPDGGWRGELWIWAEHAAVCPGWLPGVKGADGAVQELHLEDVVSMVAQRWPEAVWCDVRDTILDGYREPDELLLAALNAFNAAMEARHG